ncbi:hypothetical protein E4U22_003881, partial [Claviceps purpurea]
SLAPSIGCTLRCTTATTGCLCPLARYVKSRRVKTTCYHMSYDMSPMIHHWRSRSEAISTQLEALKSLWLTE